MGAPSQSASKLPGFQLAAHVGDEQAAGAKPAGDPVQKRLEFAERQVVERIQRNDRVEGRGREFEAGTTRTTTRSSFWTTASCDPSWIGIRQAVPWMPLAALGDGLRICRSVGISFTGLTSRSKCSRSRAPNCRRSSFRTRIFGQCRFQPNRLIWWYALWR